MENILLSICIPTYNRARFLDECLLSISNAIKISGENVEVVVCDNFSPDHTAEIVNKYKSSIKNLVYHKNDETIFAEENFYLVGQLASGKYIWLIGDDDKIREDAVVEAFKQIKTNAPVIISNFSLYSQNFVREIKPAKYDQKELTLKDHNDILVHFGTYLAFISGAIINKTLFYSIDKADYDRYKQYGLSFFYTLCKSAVNQNIGYINKPVVQCRTGNSGNYDWVKYMIIGYDEAFKDLINIGYNQQAVISAKKNFIKNEVVWYLLKLKADNQSLTYAYKELTNRYKVNSPYMALCSIILNIPAGLFSVVRSVKQTLIKS